MLLGSIVVSTEWSDILTVDVWVFPTITLQPEILIRPAVDVLIEGGLITTEEQNEKTSEKMRNTCR